MKAPTGQEFYERLIEALEDAGLPTSQTSIANWLGVYQSAVAKWKSGESFPSYENAIRLAQRAGVSVSWLLLGVGKKKEERNVDEQTVDLLEAWARMPQSSRDELLEYIRFRAAHTPPDKDPSDSSH